ncbi:enamine deaminase RidA (YjgF/YER057c/UK114 family) [Sphingomonas trueperi]|uniref:RidA family protein n=1 Tax=Sphingomonas trueperi TaxID=53317 RepID=UPI00339B3FA2
MLPRTCPAALPALLALASPAQAQAIERFDRHVTLPIARAVQVPPSGETLYVSGEVASPIVAAGTQGEAPVYGNTEAQTSSVFEKIERTLRERGYALGDVVKLTVFLVGVPEKAGQLDMDGFTRAYLRYFGTAAQPNLPARSTVQVAGLSRPGYLVEIEATAARSAKARSGEVERPAVANN